MNFSSALQLVCPPLPHIRLGFIGLGNRGMATLRRYFVFPDVSITALCDLRKDSLDSACEAIQTHHLVNPKCYSSIDGWKQMCLSNDVDVIFVCTDWQSHTEMACFAMQNGKHVALEVPASMSVSECWKLVEVAEQTRMHCFLLENCCYDPFALHSLSLVQSGDLGHISHCEGAYIHDLRSRLTADEKSGGYHNRWMSRYCEEHAGNPYPTHGLGPICQLLNIHRGDRMEYLVSMTGQSHSSTNKSMPSLINTTLIHTVRGKSIMIQYDVTTPRPYSRMQTVCGSKGFIQKYPMRFVQLETETYSDLETDKPIEELLQHYNHPFITTYEESAEKLKIENRMNYFMDCRLVHCLKHGLHLDIDVYDAAEWSCITQLSEMSAMNNGAPVEIPDFTRGHWNELKGLKFAE